jgi:hypothetical protein
LVRIGDCRIFLIFLFPKNLNTFPLAAESRKGLAQWLKWLVCLASAKPTVQLPVLPKAERETRKRH